MKYRALVIAAAVLLALFLCRAAAARGCTAPPVNEDCDGLIVFSTNDLPFQDVGLLGCVNDEIDKPYYDIFYRFNCLVTGEYRFDMCDSMWDTYIRIYSGGCGWSDGDEFAVGDDECPGSPPNADPQITVTLQGATAYWIELGTWRPDAPWAAPNDPFVFNVTFVCEGDVNGDLVVDGQDLVEVILAWGQAGGSADVDGSGIVDGADLVTVILRWGECL